MNGRDLGGILVQLPNDFIQLFNEDFSVILWQQILLDKLIGNVLGHKIHRFKLKSDGFLLGCVHLALHFETALNGIYVQHFESGA